MRFTNGVIRPDLTGKSKPNKDGYWALNAGAFGVVSLNGDEWPFLPEVERLFAPNSKLMERVRKDQLYGEWGHPSPKPGMSEQDWLSRVASYDYDRICLFMKDLKLVEGRTPNGKSCRIVKTLTRPFGDKKEVFEDSLNDPNMNTALSIRSLINQWRIGRGKFRKVPTSIWCFDGVTEQGIEVADKRHTEGFEALDYSRDQLAMLLNQASPPEGQSGMEASDSMRTHVLTDLGWEPAVVYGNNTSWLKNT